MATIKFGTSGWRAILGEDFTFRHVRIVCQAIAQVLRHEKIAQRGVIVGHDARFMGEQFAKAAAEVFAAHGIPVLLCDRETPTPTISYHILHHQLAGGINISASHNPPEWNGIKFTPSWGGPALPETTGAIEQRILPLIHGEHVKWLPIEKAKKDGLVRQFDPKPDYLAILEKHVDIDAIRQGELRIVMDPLYGTSRGYLDDFLRKAGAKMAVLHYWRDPYFGGLRPEPTPTTTVELQETVRREQAHLGLATDGDADRFGIIDHDGTFLEANQVLPLLVDYLASTRQWHGSVARSVATTHQIDRVAALHGLSTKETPVGFKYIGELLARGDVMMGGEESAGMSISGHVPEKDGILACLLVAEMVARTGKGIKELLTNLIERVGPVYSRREDVMVTESMQENLSKVREEPPGAFAGQPIQTVNQLDGCKLQMEDGSWFLLRPSGTEPLVRCYGEASTKERLDELMLSGRKLLDGAS
ncbi:phosphoglucomutase/phosphomannomutase family protein [Candidatus Nitronereus thalassa]|uniref:Phosphoglucomutase/phosphomannomutase family protein n=1 Tax=Candidatus Nitronereus thalassa TaxID=3020898 RepID=A0ABU3K9X4_9BACT|nr:phosphoglucomutase/phosphomannomutase family protein [Candidatus Nitronereus thalassa]MDT7043103.1 phosphoglucomutase/phosphomannomutase family protein [Candidatus Nitronereus thalassa]